MNRLKLYLEDTYNELLYKVTWPSTEDLQNSAIVVLIASLIIALVVLAMDQASSNVLKVIYNSIIG
ncbi:MAG: preprotein translocase subunit SecE [Bacteroidetes bacterium SW_11_45_7]|nr:MAG: preprotein translocase subunit SecE [Bacteroidetes bacterium SW_11_45_7]